MNDYPKISGLHYDERAGVWRRCLTAGRMDLRCHLSSSSKSSQTSQQYTGGAVSGSGVQALGSRNSIGNTSNNINTSSTNSAQTNSNNKSTANSTANSNNKLTVKGSGQISYTTNNTGLSGGDLQNLTSAISGIAQGAGGGSTLYASPPTLNIPGVSANAGGGFNWKLWGGIALAAAAGVYWFFFRKK